MLIAELFPSSQPIQISLGSLNGTLMYILRLIQAQCIAAEASEDLKWWKFWSDESSVNFFILVYI